ncbi:hypothetical protein ADK52_33030 [Streptomyces sp. WM6372]|uniref:hypothetical protein n=1 Tax=Streptomyces sp. WM6372 TaxID=1415555 RepID=UPI0006ADFE97|nr:hypothetical protein [Streptomyces sp. WM6372]KOU16625.1 hypothetical protein ADK52_33030 [Streptomyces sp. WM6372]
MKQRWGVLIAVGVLTWGAAGTATARASADSGGCRAAGEVFATNNTAVITDPDDERLRTRLTRFDHEVRRIIRANGARSGESTLLDGVFWSADLKRTTYERSREFDVDEVGADGLHHIADVVRKQYHQESVLTFRCLPRSSPETDAAEIRAPGVSAARLREALLADPEARERLGGGSVTVGGRLILVTPLAELPLARRLTADLGVDWNTAKVSYGDEEFVS